MNIKYDVFYRYTSDTHAHALCAMHDFVDIDYFCWQGEYNVNDKVYQCFIYHEKICIPYYMALHTPKIMCIYPWSGIDRESFKFRQTHDVPVYQNTLLKLLVSEILFANYILMPSINIGLWTDEIHGREPAGVTWCNPIPSRKWVSPFSPSKLGFSVHFVMFTSRHWLRQHRLTNWIMLWWTAIGYLTREISKRVYQGCVDGVTSHTMIRNPVYCFQILVSYFRRQTSLWRMNSDIAEAVDYFQSHIMIWKPIAFSHTDQCIFSTYSLRHLAGWSNKTSFADAGAPGGLLRTSAWLWHIAKAAICFFT